MPSRTAKTPTGIGKLNTKIWNDNGHFMVQLYDTVIYDESNVNVKLSTGGWNTPTTARRINQVIDHRKALRGNVYIKGELMFYRDNQNKVFPFKNNQLTVLI